MNYKETLQFPDDIPVSNEAQDLIQRFLTDAPQRIGTKSTDEIKKHPFFKGIDWKTLRKTKPPFIPKLTSMIDTSCFEELSDEEEEEEEDEEEERKTQQAKQNQGNNASSRYQRTDVRFIGYTYRSFQAVNPRFGTMGGTNNFGF
eukprot:TRINITY_DN5743_c0_g1_i1.p3 TRINITY_DN5743_c0_g1~~TRINITY_DN5743_c0_g1_i1.p3  ORF type:complete len:145 (-),score=56.41 TRINITY_DN5743_c0_g1_i1:92-526(-)